MHSTSQTDEAAQCGEAKKKENGRKTKPPTVMNWAEKARTTRVFGSSLSGRSKEI
jgi:hypothetical protein